MKTKFRLPVLPLTLLLLGAAPLLAAGTDAAPVDRAAQLLALRGSVPAKSAGPYVEVGTFLIQVAVKLGRPSVKLADGTWLYQRYQVDDSLATGTLVVRFNKGRVSELSLVRPAIATAMTATGGADERILVAATSR